MRLVGNMTIENITTRFGNTNAYSISYSNCDVKVHIDRVGGKHGEIFGWSWRMDQVQ